MKKFLILITLLITFSACNNDDLIIIDEPQTLLEKVFEDSDLWSMTGNDNVYLQVRNDIDDPFTFLIYSIQQGCYGDATILDFENTSVNLPLEEDRLVMTYINPTHEGQTSLYIVTKEDTVLRFRVEQYQDSNQTGVYTMTFTASDADISTFPRCKINSYEKILFQDLVQGWLLYRGVNQDNGKSNNIGSS